MNMAEDSLPNFKWLSEIRGRVKDGMKPRKADVQEITLGDWTGKNQSQVDRGQYPDRDLEDNGGRPSF